MDLVLPPRYRPLKTLGAGGMGVVYLAEDRDLDRLVAVKCIRAIHEIDSKILARFQREARVQAALHHRHVVGLYSVEFAGPAPYMVMEYVEGETLRHELLLATRLPRERVRAMVRELADALAALHDAGAIHRDLKPANVMVRADDRSYVLMDLGLAMVLGGTVLTRAQEVVGTPLYLPPEVLGDGAWTPAADQFQLAAMTFRAFAGRAHVEPPGPELSDLLQVLMAGRWVDLPAALEHEPPEVAAVLAQALAPDPGERFPDIQAFAQAFHEALGPPPGGTQPLEEAPVSPPAPPAAAEPATPTPRPRRPSVPAAALGLALGAAIGGAPGSGAPGAAARPREAAPPPLRRAPVLVGTGRLEVELGNPAALWPEPSGGPVYLLAAGRHHLPWEVTRDPALAWIHGDGSPGGMAMALDPLLRASFAKLREDLHGLPEASDAVPEDRALVEQGRRRWAALLPEVPAMLTSDAPRAERWATLRELQRWRRGLVLERYRGGSPPTLDLPPDAPGHAGVARRARDWPRLSARLEDLYDREIRPLRAHPPDGRLPQPRWSLQRVGFDITDAPNAVAFDWPELPADPGPILLEVSSQSYWGTVRLTLEVLDDPDFELDLAFTHPSEEGQRDVIFQVVLPADLAPPPGATVLTRLRPLADEYGPQTILGQVFVRPVASLPTEEAP